MTLPARGLRFLPILPAPLAASLTATAQVNPAAPAPAAAPGGSSRQTTVVIGLVVLGTKKQQ